MDAAFFYSQDYNQVCIVPILFVVEPVAVCCDFELGYDEVDGFVDDHVERGEIPDGLKQAFKECVLEHINRTIKSNEEAALKLHKAVEQWNNFDVALNTRFT